MQQVSSLKVHGFALEAVALLRPILEKVARCDRGLADQLRRAASSVALNIAEGDSSIGGNRKVRFATAAGSAREARSALALAVAWGYVSERECDAADALLDRVLRMLFGLRR